MSGTKPDGVATEPVLDFDLDAGTGTVWRAMTPETALAFGLIDRILGRSDLAV